MTTHAIEVVVWSWAYSVVSAAPAGTNLVYFAFVNYTTLGYGDVVSGAGMAAARPNDGDERCVVIRVVDRVILEVLRRAMGRPGISTGE